MVLGFDRQGWIKVFADLFLALITLYTNYTHVDLLGATSATYRTKQEFSALLPPWRRP